MKIIPLGKLDDELLNSVGGKARGLDFLVKNGFHIARGAVITEVDEKTKLTQKEINDLFTLLEAKHVAVRSSASDEDGDEYSNAGQYETYLYVNKMGINDAIHKCALSLKNERAKAYSSQMTRTSDVKMNLVVERMVDSKYAGVMFTSDPFDNTKVLIEAVEGQGENLVSGVKESHSFSISKEKFDVESSSSVDIEIVKRLYEEGLKIRDLYGKEADLEWAVDNKGIFYWLQLRPITVKEEVDAFEMDGKNPLDNHLLTSRNIGEMLPGAVTPLSISTSVLGIDYGLRVMLYTCGAAKHFKDMPDYFAAVPVGNHLFLDLSSVYLISKNVAMTSPEAINLSIMGEYYPDYPRLEGKNASKIKRFNNLCKYGKYMFSTKKSKKKLINICNTLKFEANNNAKEIYEEIDKKLPIMLDSYSCHYVCSTYSGAMNSGLYMTLGKEFENKSEFQAFVSKILSNIDGIESVDILSSLQKIARELIKINPEIAKCDEKTMFETILNNESTKVLYDAFIAKHGHRCVREAELRSKAWKNDSDALMKYLRVVIAGLGNEEVEEEKVDLDALFAQFPKKKRKTFIWLSKSSRQAVVDREFSKSYVVRVMDIFKDRYALLAKKMVEEGYLIDEDSIYFLTHQELGELINGKASLKKKALMRRNVYEEQKQLKFEDIYIGKPTPLSLEKLEAKSELNGAPVYRGKVYGKAHIVRNLEDASKLCQGEIMVAAFTDIGWSPYYSIIKALITEVGSPLSHGAVVAREYALPTIVNVKNATSLIKDGDYLFVDGEKGTVSIIDEAEYLKQTEEK